MPLRTKDLPPGSGNGRLAVVGKQVVRGQGAADAPFPQLVQKFLFLRLVGRIPRIPQVVDLIGVG